jgi:DNA-binding NtrC family response regulator
MAGRVLVAEDHPDLLAFCAAVLTAKGYEVVQATSGTVAQELLRTSSVDLLITDVKLPGLNGVDLLTVAKTVDPDTAVILITGFPAVDVAVKAMKAGAFDYLAKPFSAEQLLAAVTAAFADRNIREGHDLLRSQLRNAFTHGAMVGRSPGMLRLFDDAHRAAAVDANVLILGESGVGKERVARTIHENSARGAGPFVPINCAAIPEHLLESELFGYEQGAFTGAHRSNEGLLETAHGGTFFLDELCEMNSVLQSKLLRALEEGVVRRLGARKPRTFDARFIASTNRDIREDMRRGRFREDLFFRINVIEVHVPPLRDRREDIPLLATHFLDLASRRRCPRIEGFVPAAMDLLLRYDWPGNVRELKNAVERAVAYARHSFITLEDLPAPVRQPQISGNPESFHTWKKTTLERLEREFLARALEQHQGNVSGTARALRLHRSTLQRALRKHQRPSV